MISLTLIDLGILIEETRSRLVRGNTQNAPQIVDVWREEGYNMSVRYTRKRCFSRSILLNNVGAIWTSEKRVDFW